jgi:hypothetical protein
MRAAPNRRIAILTTLKLVMSRVQLFAESWKTNEVSVVPVGDERIIRVQITVGNKGQEVEARTLLDAFQSAGIKHKKFFSVDPDVANDVVVVTEISVRAENAVVPSIREILVVSR